MGHQFSRQHGFLQSEKVAGRPGHSEGSAPETAEKGSGDRCETRRGHTEMVQALEAETGSPQKNLVQELVGPDPVDLSQKTLGAEAGLFTTRL